MVRIAVNVSLNARSRHPAAVSWDDLALLPSPQAELEILHIVAHLQVQRALQLLPPNHRVAVILRDLEGYSYAEIALALDVPEGTAKGWVHRGRARLKDVLT
jgi:RNA polymerase sigma-70 factor (ECF subfamily)